jgi:hypothetical protein
MATLIANSICPVCGMPITDEAVELAVVSSLDERTERFRVCSSDCEGAIEADPDAYLEAAKRDIKAVPPMSEPT